MIGRQTVKALVIDYEGEKGSYVACCNSINSDIMISRSFVPPNINLIAKWVSVIVQGKEACDLIEIIDDLFETRITNGRVQVKAEATRVQGENHLYHQTSNAPSFFGFIYDEDDYISAKYDPTYYLWVTRWETNHSRWKISGEQAVSLTAGGEVHRTMEGIIILSCPNREQYIAWTKSKPAEEIIVDYRKCPGSNNMLGAWIKMTVDDNNCVVNNVTRINDVYQTLTRDDYVEVNTDFDCISKTGEPVLYNSYFGYICDSNRVFRNSPKVGSRYNAWIANVRFPNTNERWRLADSPTVCEQHPAQTTDQYGHTNRERSTRDWNREDYGSSSRSAFNSDPRRNGYRSPNPRSRTPSSRAGTSDYEPTDSDDEFYGIAPCVSNKPMDEDGQEVTSSLSQQEYRGNNSSSSHMPPMVPQDDPKIDNRDKRPKKQRTSEELEKLKLKWEEFTMNQLLSNLSKHPEVVSVCKMADQESYDTLMALLKTRNK